jgi:hypothetical protein
MQVPISDMLKSIPGAIGIRLEKQMKYTVVKKFAEVEVRHYEPLTLARTFVSGEFNDAMDIGFKHLAGFIFGENQEKKKTHMTVPVLIDQKEHGWLMSFYLSDEAENLTPLDTVVYLEQMPAKDVAVYSYSGLNSWEKMMEAKDMLLRTTNQAGLIKGSSVWWAQYDQPISLPLTKRNEALIMIKEIH